MAVVMIGVDPHKASHTAAAIGPAEELLGQRPPQPRTEPLDNKEDFVLRQCRVSKSVLWWRADRDVRRSPGNQAAGISPAYRSPAATCPSLSAPTATFSQGRMIKAHDAASVVVSNRR